jgi:uncharacterized protein (UPF0264 family)
MKAALLIVLVLFISCTNTQNANDSNQPTSGAVQDISDDEIELERGYSDISLVDQIYNKVAAKDARLKNFGKDLKRLNESKKDSLQPFDNYNEKSELYYESAKNYMAQIQDSVLKQRMASIIAASLAKYNSSTALHSNLRQVASSKELMLNDLHTAIKITKTLPVIERFQKQNLPSATPINSYSRLLDKIILQADTLSKQ